MSDGSSYSIDIQAQATGVDATAADVVSLADSIDAASAATVPFDGALQAARVQLDAAASEALAAGEAYQVAAADMKGLERAATRAGKKVAAAAKKGKDTTKLQAAARAAAAAVKVQAAAVDKLKGKAEAAAAAEQKLAKAMDTMRGASRRATAAADRHADATRDMKEQSLELLAQRSPLLGQFTQLAKTAGTGTLAMLAFAAAAVVVVAAMVAVAAAVAGGVLWLVKFAAQANKKTMEGLKAAADKAKKSFTSLFKDVDTRPLVRGAERLAELLDRNSATGSALKKLFEVLLNPVIASVDWLAPRLAEMFQGAVFGALKFAIAVHRVRNAILRAIPKEMRTEIKALAASFTDSNAAFSAGKVVFQAIAAVVVVVAVLFGLLAAAAWVAVGAFRVLMQIGAGMAAMFGFLKDMIMGGATRALAGLGKAAVKAAAEFISGLVDGINSGAGAVVAAVRNLAGSAVSALMSALDSRSPSKLTFEVGDTGLAGGVEAGVEAGTPRVKKAVERMGKESVGALQSGTQGAGGVTNVGGSSSVETTSKGGNTYYIHVHADGGDAKGIKRELLELLTNDLDATALQLGAGEVPA